MNRKYAAAAVSALALGTVALNAAEASAQEAPEPQCGNTIPANCPKYDPAHHGNMTAPEPGSGSTTTPDCHWAYHPACKEVPVPVPPAEVALDRGPSDDNASEARQAGASALGGAGLAFAGMWLYRRRHAADI